jgi:CMP-N-acetylneuraminic acid synthetase
MEKVVALLPMKGNSERVKNKNMRPFGDNPLFHCVASTLESSDLISEIIINTDSEEIAQNATAHFEKVKIHQRPPSIQGDLVEMNRIIQHDLSLSKATHFLQTHSTNPLLKKETLEAAISDYFAKLGEYDSLFSVTKWQTRLYSKTGEPVNHNPTKLERTQDLEPLFEENSNLYVFSRMSFQNAGDKRIGTTPYLFEMDKIEAIDIDEENDFQLAETIYEKQKK